MLEDGPPFNVFKDMGAEEQSSVFHPACGERAQAGFVECAVLSDSRAKEILVRSNDATFAMGALGILSGGEDAGLAMERGQL